MKKFTCIALACVISAVVAGNVSESKILDTTENIATTTAKTTANVAGTVANTAVTHPAKTAVLFL